MNYRLKREFECGLLKSLKILIILGKQESSKGPAGYFYIFHAFSIIFLLSYIFFHSSSFPFRLCVPSFPSLPALRQWEEWGGPFFLIY